MKYWIVLGCLLSALVQANPAIDMEGYLSVSREAARSSRSFT